MANQKYKNKFKVLIVSLLKDGNKPKLRGEEYNLNPEMIVRWRRKFTSKSSNFSKKKINI